MELLTVVFPRYACTQANANAKSQAYDTAYIHIACPMPHKHSKQCSDDRTCFIDSEVNPAVLIVMCFHCFLFLLLKPVVVYLVIDCVIQFLLHASQFLERFLRCTRAPVPTCTTALRGSRCTQLRSLSSAAEELLVLSFHGGVLGITM